MNHASRWFRPTLAALLLVITATGVARSGVPVSHLPTLHTGDRFAHRHSHRRPDGAEPVPIPGGIQIPGGPLLHLFAPGPTELGLMGLDIEPNTITDFNGFTAMAYPAGTATDHAGHVFDMANDIRVYRGLYVAADGTRHHGTFGFI